jgi:hypothetical protein
LKCIEEQKEQLEKLMCAFSSPVKELKAMIYDDMPKGGHAVEYERLLEAMQRLENMQLIEIRILEGMLDEEKKIDAKLQEFEGIEYKVAYLIQVKNKPLQEIADELGYSLGYIKNISASIKKESV